MPATPDPPTWRVLPDAGGHFRWASVSGEVSHAKPTGNLAGRAGSCLPSMADLVLQAAPMLLEGNGGGGNPMFRTGSGRSVSVSKSSIRKAAAVLEGGDVSERGESLGGGRGIRDGEFPMFRTGLGKSVTVRQSSIKKAATVLGGEDLQMEFPHDGCDGNGAPTFQTGSGRSIHLKQSSIRKAMSVLQDEDDKERDQMTTNKIEGSCRFSNSLFQTGSGKTLNISSAGLVTATTLLGLEGNYISSDGKVSGDVNPGFAGTSSLGPVQRGSLKSKLSAFSTNIHLSSDQLINNGHHDQHYTLTHASGAAYPPIEFQTAGGKSVLISSHALQRARNLLGDPALEDLQDDTKVDEQLSAVPDNEKSFADSSWNKENMSYDCMQQDTGIGKHIMKITPHVSVYPDQQPNCSAFQLPDERITMLNQVNFNGSVPRGSHMPNTNLSHIQETASEHLSIKPSSDSVVRMLPACRPLGEPLLDISNCIRADNAKSKCLISEKKRVGRRPSISPFKRPRNSRFNAPLKSNIAVSSSGSSMPSTSENCCCRTRISTRYPFQFKKPTIKEFFGGPPSQHYMIGDLADDTRHINADNAGAYRFHHRSEFHGIGPEDMQKMLHRTGALSSDATKEWVVNHYKWIVWKLSSYERHYPVQAGGKYLTVSNMFEELKYRYEREFNYGHRSAIKQILDGNASPASMVILCVSAVCSFPDNNIAKVDEVNEHHEYGEKRSFSNVVEANRYARIELTDGWYSLNAILDTSLSNRLRAGKIFVGQKLRIWGAGLCGWAGPVSPLEANKLVSLVIHMNGTYRAQWADPLGFCRGLGKPLAFSCIKGAGGKVPRTLVGLARIYPVLYKERFADGGSIVRSERMEKKFLQLYNQRRSTIIEDIIAEQQGVGIHHDDSEEGASIYKILETAVDPELLMADMSSQQLSSFATYQAKREEIKQSDTLKKIEEALKDAGFTSREVTPFLRVRVVGLRSKGSSKKGRPREGLITIWNPTEKQKVDLVEGQIYSVTGLTPLNFGCDMIYLQGRGSSTLWKSIPCKGIDKFEPFFTPRRSIPLSALGEVALASEFDTAAVVVHVGETYLCGTQVNQWVFLADGSKCSSEFEEPYDCLLAVKFCSSIIDQDSSTPVQHTISGSTVAFCNLLKKARDQMNHLWVAEATENSAYSVCFNLPSGHLKQAADCVQRWEKASCATIQKLRERVLYIVGGYQR